MRKHPTWHGRTSVIALVLSIALFVVACDVGGGTSSTGSASGPYGLPNPPIFTPNPTQPVDTTGAQGTPVTSRGGVAGIKPDKSGVPAFTTDDMSNAVKQHGIPDVTSSGNTTVAQSEFLTADLVGGITGYAVGGYSPQDLIGYVELNGNFDFPTPPNATPIHLTVAYEEFDATTGNIVGWGGLLAPSTTPPTVTPTVPPTQPTATPTQPTATPTTPPAQATATPTPKVVMDVQPNAITQACNIQTGGLSTVKPYQLTLFNSSSSPGPANWTINITDTDPAGNVWANADILGGSILPGQNIAVTITPITLLCRDMLESTGPIVYHVQIQYNGGTINTTDTVSP